MRRSVHFQLSAGIASRVLAHAPITILDHRLAPVARAGGDQEVTLVPGAYAAHTVLPDGSVLEATFEVPVEGVMEPVVLESRAVEPVDRSTPPKQLTSAASAVPGLVAAAGVLLNRFGFAYAVAPVRPVLRLIPMDREQGGAEQRIVELDPDGHADIEPSHRLLAVRAQRRGKADLNVMLPLSSREGARIKYAAERDPPLEARLQDERGELLRRYLVGSRFEQLQQVLERQWQVAKDLLRGKFDHPVAAAVSAYAMASVGVRAVESHVQTSGEGWFDEWTANLYAALPRLPDGACIRAELLARKGQHEAALEALLALSDRGLPIFSLGLRFAVDRLSVYRGACESGRLPRERLPEVEVLWQWLGTVASSTDFRLPLLTFTTGPDGLPGRAPRSGEEPAGITLPTLPEEAGA